MAALCRKFADNVERGGIVARLVSSVAPPHRKRATALRLAGALHYAALSGRSPQLAQTYPANNPDWNIDTLWEFAHSYLDSDFDHVEAFIQSDPQTNETRRAIALLPGFQAISGRFKKPLHLLELGASAGLNQNWDKFSYSGGDWDVLASPDRGVSIKTDWDAPGPDADLPIVVSSRGGCDLNPIDLGKGDNQNRLKSYCWADQPERLARLDAAMKLAVEERVHIDQADAAQWLERKLKNRPNGETAVIFHSVFLHYPPSAIRNKIIDLIETAGRHATPDAPLAWLCMEADSVFEKNNPKLGVFRVRLQTWPGGDVETLGYTDGHVNRFTSNA